MNTLQLIDEIIEICQIHAKRLQWATEYLPFPIDEYELASLTGEQLAVLDQFSMRFSKLQDVMGQSLFPAVLELTKEQGDFAAFIDKLNQLEKIGAIPSAQKWLILREMRNNFAHEYPNDPEIQAAILNTAFNLAKDLLETYEGLQQFINKYRK